MRRSDFSDSGIVRSVKRRERNLVAVPTVGGSTAFLRPVRLVGDAKSNSNESKGGPRPPLCVYPAVSREGSRARESGS